MKVIYIRLKSNLSTNMLLFIMYMLMLTDYILTYWGVNILGGISESNPLMVILFNIPFNRGILIRCLIALVLVILLKIPERTYLNKGKNYKKVLLLIMSIQVIPYAAHLVWIYLYFYR